MVSVRPVGRLTLTSQSLLPNWTVMSTCQLLNINQRSCSPCRVTLYRVLLRLVKRSKQRKLKEKADKKTQKTTINVDRKSLTNIRVIQRNLVYVIGLPPGFAKEEVREGNSSSLELN